MVHQIQHVQSVCRPRPQGLSEEASSDSPADDAAPDSPADDAAQGQNRVNGTTSLSRRVRTGSAGPQGIVSANPDLSLIDEGSHEPSLTLSQRLGGIGYDEEEDDPDGYYDNFAGELASNSQLQAGLSSSLRSRLSSVEPEDLAERIQDALVASPARTIPHRQQNASLSPSPSMESLGRPDCAPESATLDTVSNDAEDTIRQSRRRNSGVLPQPPQDVRQRSLSTSAGSNVLHDLSLSPGQLDLQFAKTARSRSSIASDTLSVQSEGSLGRTIRHSSFSTSLRASSASPEAVKSSKSSAGVSTSLRRRKSTPSLTMASSSVNILDQAFNSAKTVGTSSKARSHQSIASDGTDASGGSIASSSASRRQLVAGMQGRPTGGPVSLTVPNTATSAVKMVAGRAEKVSAPPIVTSVRRMSTANNAKPVKTPWAQSGSSSNSNGKSGRSRSTTPDLPPPLGDGDYTPILQSMDAGIAEGGGRVRSGRGSSPLTPMVFAGVAQPVSTVKPDKGKGKFCSTLAREKTQQDTISVTGSETSLETALTDSRPQSQQSRQSRSSAVSPATSAQSTNAEELNTVDIMASREARRARSAVNYQEPSLSKLVQGVCCLPVSQLIDTCRKMRQPAGYVPSIKTVVSTRGVSGHHAGSTLGVRRKSSLEAVGRGRGNFGTSSESVALHRLESISHSDDEVELS